MNRSQNRTNAKRKRALARSLKSCTVQQFYERGPEMPSPKAVDNYFIKVGHGWFRISCTSRPDDGLRAKFAKRKEIVQMDKEHREKAEERRAYHAAAGDRRRTVAETIAREAMAA